MKKVNIADASVHYREAANVCRSIFAAAGREFVEPEGVRALIQNARVKFTEHGDEESAVKEIENARVWLIGIARKFLRAGVEYFDGRIHELSYMSLDLDIVENMEARLKEFRDAIHTEDGDRFDLRLAAYTALAKSVYGARDQQRSRDERRAQRETEDGARRKRVAAERERERIALTEANRQRQEAAEAAARDKRGEQFDELFA